MDHQRLTGVAERSFKTVGITEIERDIVLRLRIQHAGRDMIEAFRRLAIAFFRLGAEFAGPAAHRIGLEELVTA